MEHSETQITTQASVCPIKQWIIIVFKREACPSSASLCTPYIPCALKHGITSVQGKLTSKEPTATYGYSRCPGTREKSQMIWCARIQFSMKEVDQSWEAALAIAMGTLLDTVNRSRLESALRIQSISAVYEYSIVGGVMQQIRSGVYVPCLVSGTSQKRSKAFHEFVLGTEGVLHACRINLSGPEACRSPVTGSHQLGLSCRIRFLHNIETSLG